MRLLRAILLIFIIMVSSGCYRGINGKVVDNATGKPLEGALVVVQWTRPDIHSIEGLSVEVIMNTETLTDKEGGFVIRSTPINPFANPPDMIIYKEGYIPWRNDEIFPGGNKVKDHEWKNNKTYNLDVFTENFTTRQIEDFLFLVSGGNLIPKYEDLKNKLSRRRSAEDRAKEIKEWLNDFRNVIASLGKGPYSYDYIKHRLVNKDIYEIKWLIDEAIKTNSVVNKVMKDNDVSLDYDNKNAVRDPSVVYLNGYGPNSINDYSSAVFTKH